MLSYYYHALLRFFLAFSYFVLIEALAHSRIMVTYYKVGGMQDVIAYSNHLHPRLPFQKCPHYFSFVVLKIAYWLC